MIGKETVFNNKEKDIEQQDVEKKTKKNRMVKGVLIKKLLNYH